MVAITLRPGGAPSTPREHHDEALKFEARRVRVDGGGLRLRQPRDGGADGVSVPI